MENNQDELRNKIIGLGKGSFQKSYYPELQKKISELNLYKSVFEQTHDIIIVVIPETSVIEYINNSGKKFFGVLRPEHRLTVENTIGKEYWQLVNEKMYNSIYLSERLRFEYTFRDNGKDFVLDTTISQVEEDEKLYLCLVIRDITREVETQSALRRSEEKFRTIFQNAPVGIFRSAKSGKILDMNQALANMIGYANLDEALNAISNLAYDVYVHPGQRRKIISEVAGDKDIHQFKCEFRNIQGNNWIGKLHIKKQSTEGDEVFFEGIIEDITEITEYQEKLEESEQKFRSIFRNSVDAIAIFTLDDLKFKEANDIFFKKTGYDLKQLTSISPFELISPRFHPEIEKRLQLLFKNQYVPPLEVEVFTVNEEIIPVEISSGFLLYNGQPAVLTHVRDISERKNFERKLLDTIIQTEENERKRIASDLHDEIGPLLSTLNMYASTLQDIKDEDKKNEFIGQIQELVQEATTNVRQISNSLSPHILNNFGLHTAMSSLLENQKKFYTIKFRSNTDGKRFPVNVEVTFYRIFKELLNNTIKHAEADTIMITLTFQDNILNMEYFDNGKGFDMEAILNDKSKGIGLYNIVNRIQAIGGNYSFNSLKKGFIFTFIINTNLVNSYG
jgi:PAS domain S-box-containing protein